MVSTLELYRVSQNENIPVMFLEIPENGSMCIQTAERNCYIGMDCSVLENEASKRVHLAHELGHCVEGAFYSRYASMDIRQKHEHRADKWAIEKIIPLSEFNRAISEGHTEIWDLAEYFNVTEDFMRKAVCWYSRGNLAAELYF